MKSAEGRAVALSHGNPLVVLDAIDELIAAVDFDKVGDAIDTLVEMGIIEEPRERTWRVTCRFTVSCEVLVTGNQTEEDVIEAVTQRAYEVLDEAQNQMPAFSASMAPDDSDWEVDYWGVDCDTESRAEIVN